MKWRKKEVIEGASELAPLRPVKFPLEEKSYTRKPDEEASIFHGVRHCWHRKSAPSHGVIRKNENGGLAGNICGERIENISHNRERNRRKMKATMKELPPRSGKSEIDTKKSKKMFSRRPHEEIYVIYHREMFKSKMLRPTSFLQYRKCSYRALRISSVRAENLFIRNVNRNTQVFTYGNEINTIITSSSWKSKEESVKEEADGENRRRLRKSK